MEAARSFGAARFAAMALDPATPVAGGDAALRRGHRLAVYRNNVLGGLVRALEARFPVVRRLVGNDFFAAMAAAFAARHPPRSPLMFEYGAGFDAFIASFPPAAALPYLPDVAAIEIARGRAFHAADAPSLSAAKFAGLEDGQLAGLRLLLHPSVTVLRSRHPVVSIWTAHLASGEPSPVADWRAEDALVFRAGDSVATVALGPGEATFLGVIAAIAPLGEAMAFALAETAEFDPRAAIARLIGGGLVAALQETTETAE